MKTALYLQSTAETSCARMKYSGARRALIGSGIDLRKVVSDKPTVADLRELVAFWNACGIIIDCGGRNPPVDAKALGGIPVVYLDLAHEGAAEYALTVAYDIRATCNLAARELLSLDCASYGYCGYGAAIPWSEERGRVFTHALRLNGHEVETFALAPKDCRLPQFYRRLAAWVDGLPKPCGIFAADDAYAQHVQSAVQSLKLHIPNEVALLGVDDETTTNATPGLSSIRLNFEEAGRLAAGILVDSLGRRRATPIKRHFGPIQLFRRGSTRRLRRPDNDLSEVLERIRREVSQGLSAAQVAGWMPGSRRLAEIRFRQATGHSILEEITAARIDLAKELLVSSDDAIGEIAEHCGYRTANAFRDAFKSETGLIPRDWRKRH